MQKTALLLLSTLLIATGAYAGGSIFGHKAKSVNTNGVHSIGVHICSSLECPPVRIFKGKCDQDHMSMHWGVCVCNKGYVPRNGKCDACPKGQYSDGITECKSCPDGMYAEAGNTKCTTCPTPTDTICNGTPEVDTHNCPTQELVACSGTTPVCKADNKTCECPDNANCTTTPWACNDGYYRTGVEGFDKIVDVCVPCPDENATKCNGDGISTECKEGYEVSGDACVEVPTCSSTIGDPCEDNSTVCPGYYCSIAWGTTDDGKRCGTSKYIPGAGTVESLGTPREPKTGYLSSPSYVASWDAAMNYCKALKSTIAQGVTVNGVNYGSYDSLSNGLALLPSGCSMNDSCSALPSDDYYWLDALMQWDCDWKNYSTIYGGNSCSAFCVYYGDVEVANRGFGIDYSGYALCE